MPTRFLKYVKLRLKQTDYFLSGMSVKDWDVGANRPTSRCTPTLRNSGRTGSSGPTTRSSRRPSSKLSWPIMPDTSEQFIYQNNEFKICDLQLLCINELCCCLNIESPSCFRLCSIICICIISNNAQ